MTKQPIAYRGFRERVRQMVDAAYVRYGKVDPGPIVKAILRRKSAPHRSAVYRWIAADAKAVENAAQRAINAPVVKVRKKRLSRAKAVEIASSLPQLPLELGDAGPVTAPNLTPAENESLRKVFGVPAEPSSPPQVRWDYGVVIEEETKALLESLRGTADIDATIREALQALKEKRAMLAAPMMLLDTSNGYSPEELARFKDAWRDLKVGALPPVLLGTPASQEWLEERFKELLAHVADLIAGRPTTTTPREIHT